MDLRKRLNRVNVFIFICFVSLYGESPVDVTYEEGKYTIKARFEIESSQKNVWNVLTDYENIEKYITYIKKSNKDSSLSDRIYEQEGVYQLFGILPISVHIMLKVEETPYNKIIFKDISHQDFDLYQGCWHIQSDGTKTIIIYELQAIPNFMQLHFVTKKIFLNIYTEMVSDIRQEVLLRAMK